MTEQINEKNILPKMKEAIPKILQNYAEGGIYQEELIDILTKDGNGSRGSFYKYKEELKKSSIMKYGKGEGYQKIFPTTKGQKLAEFSDEIQAAAKLLDLIEKYPEIGDCVSVNEIEKIPGLDRSRREDLARRDKFIETIAVENSQGVLGKNDVVYSLQGRYNILKIFPFFLINYIHQAKRDSKQQEFFNIANPLIDRCYREIQKSYIDSIYYSAAYSKKLKSSVDLYLIAGLPISDIKAEFLRIIGRFYFLVGLKFSNNLKDESSEQGIISNFVNEFYSKTGIYDDEVTKRITGEEIMDFITDEKITQRSMDKDKFAKLMKIKNSFAGQFAIKRRDSQDDDPYLISDYYNKWIFNPGMRIFSGIEGRFIDCWIKYNEDYDKEASHLEHDNPLEINRDPFHGELIKSSSGESMIILRERHDRITPWKGRTIRVLLDNEHGL